MLHQHDSISATVSSVCVDGLKAAFSQISHEITDPPPPQSDGFNIFQQASMNIAAGGFRAFASTSSQVLGPTGLTYTAKAQGTIQDSITPVGGGAAGTRYTVVLPLHLTGAGSISINPLVSFLDFFQVSCNSSVGGAFPGSICGQGR